ncbi:MAG TPA: hypothetical protein VMI54_15395 [Polyangiaceae bacterium]|nr:hypothetical protein [Polyangiaceae bacterium]
MAQKSLHQTSLVLVELGAAWPSALMTEAGICRVLAEAEGEGPLAFAARAEDFAVGAFPRGTQVTHALVACNQRADETAEAARRAVAESLLARLAGHGTLVFVASDDASDRFRRRLFDLVADLDKAGSGDRRVRAQFGEEGRRTASGPASSDGSALAKGVVSRVA